MKTTLNLVVATLVLSWPAFFNGYPFIFPDTGGYLSPAIQFVETGWLSAAWSRPAFYGIVALPIHWQWSLWPLVFVQAFLTAHFLLLTIRTVLGRVDLVFYFFVVVTLALFTSLPWHVATLIPDIFAPIVVLGIYLLVTADDRLRPWERIYVLAITTGAVSFHFSHFALAAILSATGAAMWFHNSFRQIISIRTLIIGFLPFALALSALVAVNKVYRGEASASTHSSLFVLSRYKNIVNLYLNKHCDTETYALCEFKDENRNVLWGEKGLARTIGANKLNQEAKEILRKSIELYPIEFVNSALQSILYQMVRFWTAGWIYPFADTPADASDSNLFRYFPSEYPTFLGSHQSDDSLPKSIVQLVHTIAIFAALPLFLLFLCDANQRHDVRLQALYAFVFVGLLGNAAIVATLSGVVERYQSRLIWLVVLVTLIAGYRLISERRTDGSGNDTTGQKSLESSA